MSFGTFAVTGRGLRRGRPHEHPAAGRGPRRGCPRQTVPPPVAIIDSSVEGVSELVASLLPNAHVIKAFYNMYGSKIGETRSPGWPQGPLLRWHDADAKSQFRAVAEEFGYTPLDLGPLAGAAPWRSFHFGDRGHPLDYQNPADHRPDEPQAG